MDLGTVRSKLESNQYATLIEFLEDINLVRLYNSILFVYLLECLLTMLSSIQVYCYLFTRLNVQKYKYLSNSEWSSIHKRAIAVSNVELSNVELSFMNFNEIRYAHRILAYVKYGLDNVYLKY